MLGISLTRASPLPLSRIGYSRPLLSCFAQQQQQSLAIPRRLCSSESSVALPTTKAADSAKHPTTATSNSDAPDHRILGTKQELFTTSIYSPGCPILLPNGARVFNRLVEFLRQQYVHYGFEEVITPTIYKKALWAKSGHLENYAEDMFTVTSTSPARAVDDASSTSSSSGQTQNEDDEYGLKPMNCPGHCLIYAAQKRSYRDLPIRYADFSPLHRNETSGSLSGLTRVRRFHQDDGHIFCLPSQIEEEIRQTLEFVDKVYKVLQLGPCRLVLSTRPGEYMGELSEWDHAEDALRKVLSRTAGDAWSENPGDGAFYGPKIDIILRDSDGKEHQTATIQLDFQLPKRFELEYDAPTPPQQQTEAASPAPAPVTERPVMIHRAVLGSVERLMALLIEHYNGKWPFWLNPRQVMIITVKDPPHVIAKADEIRDVLRNGSRKGPAAASKLVVDTDYSKRTVNLKIREAKMKGYGVIVTIGPTEAEAEAGSAVIPVDFGGIPIASLGDDEPASTALREHLATASSSKRMVKLKPTALLEVLEELVENHQ